MLFSLVLAELWERFSYYGMRVPSSPRAADFPMAMRYAMVLTWLCCTPFRCWRRLADQALGARRAVYYGAVVLVLGHAILTLDGAQLGFARP